MSCGTATVVLERLASVTILYWTRGEAVHCRNIQGSYTHFSWYIEVKFLLIEIGVFGKIKLVSLCNFIIAKVFACSDCSLCCGLLFDYFLLMLQNWLSIRVGKLPENSRNVVLVLLIMVVKTGAQSTAKKICTTSLITSWDNTGGLTHLEWVLLSHVSLDRMICMGIVVFSCIGWDHRVFVRVHHGFLDWHV